MPVNGLIFKGTLCYGVELDASVNSASNYVSVDYQASLATFYVQDTVNMLAGIEIDVVTHSYSTDSTTMVYKGPNAPFGGLVRSVPSFLPNAYVHAEFDVEVYGMDNQLMRLDCSAIRVDMSGEVTNLGGFTANSTGLGPAYLPVVGGMYGVSGYVNVGQEANFGAQDDFTVDGVLTIGGGYRFKAHGSEQWESLPVTLAPVENVANSGPEAQWDATYGNSGAPPAHWTYGTGSAPYGLDARYPAVATNTWGTQLRALGHWEHVSDQYGTGLGPNATDSGHEFDDRHFSNGAVYVVPSAPKGWRFFESSTQRNLLLGWRLPYVKMNVQRAWEDSETYGTAGDPSSYGGHHRKSTGQIPQSVLNFLAEAWHNLPAWLNKTETIYEARAGEVASLSSAGSRLDDCLDKPAYAIPYGYHAKVLTESDWSNGGLTSNGRITAEYCQVTGFDCEDPSDGTPVWNLPLWHREGLIRYFQSGWVHPGWNMGSLYEDWAVNGASVNREDYWKPGGIQYYANSSLPSGQITHTRSDDAISAVGGVNAFQPWLDNYYGFKRPEDDTDNPVTTGTGFEWIGYPSAWHTEQVNIKPSHTFDASTSSLWSIHDGDGSLSFKPSGLEVAMTGKTATVDLRLGSFDVEPFMWPHIAEKVAASWVDGFDVAVSLVALDGGETEVTKVQGTFPLGKGKGRKYAGSWDVDNGMGAAYTGGTDVKPGGISDVVDFDPELCATFSLVSGHGGRFLRFRISKQDGTTTNTCLLGYPVLSRTGWYEVVWESRQVCVLVFKYRDEHNNVVSGPAIRYGSLLYFDPMLGLQNPPVPQGLGFKASEVDALCWINQWLLGKPMAYNLVARLSAINNAFEGQSLSQSDRNSMGYPLPMKEGKPAAFALVNSCKTLPCLAFLPPKKPNPDTWLLDGERDAGIWVWGVEPRQYVANGNPLVIKNPAGAEVSATNRQIGDDWYVSWQKTALSNSESPNWQAFWNDKLYARVSPWHGYSANLVDAAQRRGLVSYDVARHGRHVRAHVESDKAVLRLSTNAAPLAEARKLDTGISCSALCARFTKDNDHKVALVYIDPSGAVKQVFSPDEGKTWTMPTTIADSGIVPALVVSSHGTRYYYWLADAGGSYTIRGQVRDQNDRVIVATFDAVTGVDADGLAAAESYGAGGSHRIVLVYSVGGVLTSKSSPNGKAFS